MPDRRLERTRQAYRRIPVACKEHPTYKAVRQPKVACSTCWKIWFAKTEGK